MPVTGLLFFNTTILTGRQYDLPDPIVDSDPDTFVEICLGESEKQNRDITSLLLTANVVAGNIKKLLAIVKTHWQLQYLHMPAGITNIIICVHLCIRAGSVSFANRDECNRVLRID